MDAGGGGPLGEDDGVVAEFVADGGVERLDKFAGFADLAGGLGGAADVPDPVTGLLAFFPGDEGDIRLEFGDERGVDRVGLEFREGGGGGELQEEILRRGQDRALGGWMLCCTNFRGISEKDFMRTIAMPKMEPATMPEDFPEEPYLKSVWVG